MGEDIEKYMQLVSSVMHTGDSFPHIGIAS